MHPRFAPLAEALERQILQGGGGAAACVYVGDQCVADIWGGARDREGTPWEASTPVVSFSTTKGVASTALHILVDRGKLSYEDPVAKHWPEFARAGKERITVRELMSHQAGLYRIRAIVDGAHRLLDWDHMVAALAEASPSRFEGTSAYHGLTYGHLIGELVRRIDGRPLGQFVRNEIAEPLGLDGMWIGAPDAAIDRRARLIHIRVGDDGRTEHGSRRGSRPVLRTIARTGIFDGLADALMPTGISKLHFDAPETLRVAIPSANGLFTARSLARMYAVWANGGELDGVRLFSSRRVEEAGRLQVRGRDRVLFLRMGWRMGFHAVPTFRGQLRHAFGHFGYGGSGAWACPRRRLSFAMTVNTGHGTPMGDVRVVRMGSVALSCARSLRLAREAA